MPKPDPTARGLQLPRFHKHSFFGSGAGGWLWLIVLLMLLAGGGCSDEDKGPAGPSAPSGAVPTPPAAPSRTLVFAADATWPPMEFLGPDGRVTGLSVDYCEAAGALAGFQVSFINVPWANIFRELGESKFDAICSSVSITPERRKEFDFSIPYFKVRQALVVPSTSVVRSLGELSGRPVGVQVNTTGGQAVRRAEGVKAAEYEDLGRAFVDLAEGRLAGVVCDDPVAAQYALAMEQYKGRFRIAAVIETADVEYYGLAVRKGNREVLALINRGIELVQKSGRDREILKKWIDR